MEGRGGEDIKNGRLEISYKLIERIVLINEGGWYFKTFNFAVVFLLGGGYQNA